MNQIPADVENTPAGPDGNGFLALGIHASSIVGSDGNIYVRRNGVVSIAPEEEDQEC
jgi:hypothetical protein